MSQEKEHLQAIQDIKTMMERSTKFSSISGKAGIVVGMLAVIVFAGIKWFDVTTVASLFVVMVGTLMIALSIGLYLSIAKAKKEGAAIFDTTAKRFLVQFYTLICWWNIVFDFCISKSRRIYPGYDAYILWFCFSACQ